MRACAGIAATTAYKQVKALGSLTKVIEGLDKTKHPVPEACDYEEVRRLFVKPDVADPESVELKWTDPDETGLMKFLVEEKVRLAQSACARGVRALPLRQHACCGPLRRALAPPAWRVVLPS